MAQSDGVPFDHAFTSSSVICSTRSDAIVLESYSELLDEDVIPKVVQITSVDRWHRPSRIPATVVIIGRMERLVQIADEMQKEFEGDYLLLFIRPRIGKLIGKFLDLVDHVILRGAS